MSKIIVSKEQYIALEDKLASLRELVCQVTDIFNNLQLEPIGTKPYSKTARLSQRERLDNCHAYLDKKFKAKRTNNKN